MFGDFFRHQSHADRLCFKQAQASVKRSERQLRFEGQLLNRVGKYYSALRWWVDGLIRLRSFWEQSVLGLLRAHDGT